MQTKTNNRKRRPLAVKCSKADTIYKSHRIPKLRFENQQLTSYSGLVIFQRLFALLDLRERLRLCFRHLAVSPIFGYGRIILLLIVHFLIGFRRLRDTRFYADDPIVKRVIGLKRLPDVATISRALAGVDDSSVAALQQLLRQMVLDRLTALELNTVTLDFDGSVIGTGRFAEGTAIGFNRKKKGQRSYYPLFCTIAQTGQVFDVLHRSGNVHDSNGAQAFIQSCIQQVRQSLPGVRIETRMDGAFFSDAIVQMLDEIDVEYTISVPFARLAALKEKVERRRKWDSVNQDCDSFELLWKPESWDRRHRFIAIRKQVRIQFKGPVQLDLFTPYEYGFDFKVILTNKSFTPAKILAFHNGR
ncbi:transposase, partial [Microbulbifer sp.]|uniref:transposase n=1 Tax=Microbulbifer sp. TaxID=1908541 RepID=UPI003F391249